GLALDDEEPDRGPDPHGDERPSLPLRHVSTDPDGDQAGRRGHGEGREVMSEFSRRTFLKGSGALIVGFSVAGVAGKAANAADSPFASNAPYDPNAIDSFIAIHSDNTATLKSGRVELGQGTSLGLIMIAAEELDMDVSQMRWVNVDTNVTPD